MTFTKTKWPLIALAALTLIGSNSASAEPITLSAPGISLQALTDARVQVSDQSGVPRLVLGGYRLVWSPPATDAGSASLVSLTDGTKAIQIDYTIKGDPSGKIKIQGQFSAGVNRVHIRYDVWGPDDLNAGGAMIGCVAQPATTATTTVKLGRWVRPDGGGVPYEVPDGNLFGYQLPGESVYLALHGNTDWRDQWSVHFPAAKAETGHFVAEGDLVLTTARPAAAGAILAGRPLALDIWTDQPNNMWSSGAKPFGLKSQTVNTSANPKTVTLTWTAHDFDGQVVASGTDRRLLASGEAWDRPLSIPAPKQGIVFVDVDASNGTDTVFCRTNLAVLPQHAFLSGDESIFGLSAFFPLPSEAAAESLLQRIGVRWIRFSALTNERANALKIHQNSHAGMPPSGKPGSYDTDPAKKTQWIDKILSEADQHNARYLELFNEWNMDGGIGKGKWADTYARDWLVPVNEERTKTGAKVKIMSMGLAGMDEGFLDKVHDAGGWNLFEALAIHAGRGRYTADYGGDEQGSAVKPDYWNFLGTIEAANNVLAKYGRKELWVTEAYACTFPNSSWFDTYRHSAENVVLSYALAAAKGVRVMDWYQLNDGVWYDHGGVNPKDSEYHYGLLNRDLSPKPSLLGYATIAAALDQAKFVRWIKFVNTHTKGLLFSTPRGPMAVLWDRTDGYMLNTRRDIKTDKFAAPEPWVDDWKTKVALELPASGKSLRVIDCVGRERTIPAANGTANVTLDGAPRIVYGVAPGIGE
ncbi:MAG: hypothetical protein P4L33_07820 [Capsulimonadaceae bacterium]|nr:hypothetical protein [Capsulimonadaceae bacterium]